MRCQKTVAAAAALALAGCGVSHIDKYTPKMTHEMPDHELRKTVVWRVAIERLTGKRSGR